jgi:hypothetical protein
MLWDHTRPWPCVGVCVGGLIYSSIEIPWYYGEDFPATSFRASMVGQPLADGWRFVLVGNKGDRKQRKESNGFTRYYKQTFICERCLAATMTKKCLLKNMNFGCFGRHAPWRATQMDNDTYLKTCVVDPYWSCVKGFCTDGSGRKHFERRGKWRVGLKVQGLVFWFRV